MNRRGFLKMLGFGMAAGTAVSVLPLEADKSVVNTADIVTLHQRNDMSLISINHHDWFDAAEILFEESAKAKGIQKGALAWYAHSIELPVPEPVHLTDSEGVEFGQRIYKIISEQVDKIISENFGA